MYNIAHVRSWSKNGAKKPKYKARRKSLAFYSIQLVSSSLSFKCIRLSKLDEKWPSYDHAKRTPKRRWPILGRKMDILATFFEI